MIKKEPRMKLFFCLGCSSTHTNTTLLSLAFNYMILSVLWLVF